jgi:hypothetical protein
VAQLVATYPDTFSVPAYVTDRKPAKGEVGRARAGGPGQSGVGCSLEWQVYASMEGWLQV